MKINVKYLSFGTRSSHLSAELLLFYPLSACRVQSKIGVKGWQKYVASGQRPRVLNCQSPLANMGQNESKGAQRGGAVEDTLLLY